MKLSEGGAVGPEYGRDEEENFFKRLGKWRSGRRNPSKLHHTEEKDGRPPPPWGAPLAHPMPPSFFVCSSLLLSSPLFVAGGVVFCLASQVVVFWQCCRPPFSMSASPDSCLLRSFNPDGWIFNPSVSIQSDHFLEGLPKNLPKTKANIKQQGKGKWTRCFIFSLINLATFTEVRGRQLLL